MLFPIQAHHDDVLIYIIVIVHNAYRTLQLIVKPLLPCLRLKTFITTQVYHITQVKELVRWMINPYHNYKKFMSTILSIYAMINTSCFLAHMYNIFNIPLLFMFF